MRRLNLALTVIPALWVTAIRTAGPSPGDDYVAIVGAYRESPNPAIDRLLALPEVNLQGAIAAATRAETSGGWPAAELAAAAMLHTDAAMHPLEHPPGPAVDHLNQAQELTPAAVDRSAGYAWFEREWYPIVLGALRAGGFVHRADRFALEETARLRSNAWAAFAQGMENEGRGARAEFFRERSTGPARQWFAAAAKGFGEARVNRRPARVPVKGALRRAVVCVREPTARLP